MIRRLSLRTILGGIVGVLALLLIAVTAHQVIDASFDRQLARSVAEGNETSDLLLLAAGQLAAERGMTNAALNAPQPITGEAKAAIQQRRDRADHALGRVVSILRTNAQISARLAEVEAAAASLRELRPKADAALAHGREARDLAVTTIWVPTVTKLIETSQRMRLASEYEADAAETRLADLQRLKHFIWVISEFTGRERAAIGGTIAAGRAIEPDDLQRLAGFRGQVDLAWGLVEAYAAKANASGEIKGGVEAVRRAMFGEFEQVRQRVYRAGTAAQPYPLNSADWIAASTQAIEVVLRLSEAAGQVTAQLAADTSHRRTITMLIAATALLLGIAAALVSFRVVSRRITTPLRQMTETTALLADGSTDLVVPGLDRGDEIGTLAQAVEVFRQKLIENAQLSAEQAARDRVAIERARALDALTRGFDHKVGALTSSMSGAATELEATAQSMSATAEQTNRNTVVVAGAVEQTSGNVQTVAAATEQMSASIRGIAQQVTNSSTIAARAAEDARSADTTVQSLAAGADKIGHIVTLINDLAAQTNLLALNATIEAARAGEVRAKASPWSRAKSRRWLDRPPRQPKRSARRSLRSRRPQTIRSRRSRTSPARSPRWQRFRTRSPPAWRSRNGRPEKFRAASTRLRVACSRSRRVSTT